MRGFPDRTIQRTALDGIRAGVLVAQVGAKKLVGKRLMTEPYGDWPGGPATVTEVGHDANAPDIVFLVRHDAWRGNDGNDDGIMGVFGYEVVQILPEKPELATTPL